MVFTPPNSLVKILALPTQRGLGLASYIPQQLHDQEEFYLLESATAAKQQICQKT